MKKLFLLSVLMLLPLLASADAVEINGIYYNLIEKGEVAEVTKNPNKYSGSVVIPESVVYEGNTYNVTSIGEDAFIGSGLTSVVIPNSVTTIGNYAFYNCKGLTSINIPNSVTSIGESSFCACRGLTSLTIPNSLTYISGSAFEECSGLITVTIPSSVTTIGLRSFRNCTSLTSVTIPNSLSIIGTQAFNGCSSLTTVTLGSGINKINTQAFSDCKELKDIYCLKESNPWTSSDAFKDSYIEYATLHVPANSINVYKTAVPWKNSKNIVALDGETTEAKKCATPTISYQWGQLSFSCDTEGVTFVTNITDADIKTHYDASIYLTATYNISVYATKDGYENSDVTTATLSWLDGELETDISGGVANVRAKPVLIQSNGSTLSIAGLDEGTAISVYDISGKMVGSTTAASDKTNISTSLRPGEISLVKIGSKTIKVVMK